MIATWRHASFFSRAPSPNLRGKSSLAYDLWFGKLTRSSSREVRISWYPIFVLSIIVGEASPEKGVKGHYWGT